MSLTLEDILAIPDLVVHQVECPTWGRTVSMRAPSAGRRDRFESSIYDPDTKQPDNTLFRCRVVALCLCDEDGKFLCDDPIAGAIRLADKSGKAINELFTAAMALSGYQDTKETSKN